MAVFLNSGLGLSALGADGYSITLCAKWENCGIICALYEQAKGTEWEKTTIRYTPRRRRAEAR